MSENSPAQLARPDRRGPAAFIGGLEGGIEQGAEAIKKRSAKSESTHSPTLNDRLVSELQSIVDALQSGEPLEKLLTVRTVQLDLEPTTSGPGDVKALRDKFGASQALFAKFLGVSVATLQKWEQGQRPVPAIAARYLDDIQAFPELWSKRIKLAKL